MIGYDPEKWAKANAEIRDEYHLEGERQSFKTIQPAKGKHRFAHCQVLYEEAHAFLKQRRWAPAKVDMEVAGITWMELFTLYDLIGNRSEQGQRQQNLEATRRAEKRRQKARCARFKKVNLNETTVVTKPTLDEEIKLSKAIVRHSTKHEAEQEKAKWFRADTRASLRRLSDLGVSGHQPTIMAY